MTSSILFTQPGFSLAQASRLLCLFTKFRQFFISAVLITPELNLLKKKKDDNFSICTLTGAMPNDLQPLLLSDYIGDYIVSVGLISISTLPQVLSVTQSLCGSNITVKLQHFDIPICYQVQKISQI